MLARTILLGLAPFLGLQEPGVGEDPVPETIPVACVCLFDTHYTDMGGDPGCVQTWGITYSGGTNGICEEIGCPTPKNCSAYVTASMTGSADCEMAMNILTPFGFDFIVPGTGSVTMAAPLSLACGTEFTIFWRVGEETTIGYTDIKCLPCEES